MPDSNRTCLSPGTLDALASGHAATDDDAEHLARCRGCSHKLEAARFALRFARVMSEKPSVAPDPMAPPAGPGSFPPVHGYRIRSELARGGQGVVYLAEQAMTGQLVAIKVLHQHPSFGGESQSARARFLREIRIIATLHHPGIVRLLDSLTLVDGRDVIVMELVEGRPLNEWLDQTAPKDKRALLALLAEVAEALHHAHQRGVIHRDLKPSNILIDDAGRPHLLDFGIATLAEHTDNAERVTRTGEFTGTLAYAAPEQVSGLREAPDVRTDIYALGVIGHRVLTGAMPYEVEGSLDSIIRNIKETTPTASRRPVIGADPWTVLSKAMSKSPARRYQSAADMASDLRHAARGEAINARKDSRLYVLKMTARRHRVAIALAAVVLLGLISVLGVLALGNARLNTALRDSRLQQARALLLAGGRARAEAILWPIYDKARRNGGGHPPLWTGPPGPREALWALLEIQAQATCLAVIEPGLGDFLSMTTRSDGAFSLVLPDGRTARLDLVADRPVFTFGPSLGAGLLQGLFSTSGDRLVAIGREGLRSIDPETGDTIAQRPLPGDPGDIGGAVVAQWGVAVCSKAGRLWVFSLPGLEPLLDTPVPELDQTPWMDTGTRTIGYLAQGLRLVFIDLDTGLERTTGHGAKIDTGSFASRPQTLVTPDRTQAIIAHTRGVMLVPLTESRGAPQLLNRPGYRGYAIIDPTGIFLSIRAYGDSTLRLWRMDNWEEARGLPGHDRAVTLHAFTADGSRIITTDRAGTMRVWAAPGHVWRSAISEPTARTHALAIDASAGEVLLCDSTGSLQARPLDGGPARPIAPASETGFEVVRSAISERGMLAIAGLGNQFALSNPDGGNAPHLRPGALSQPGSIMGIAFQPGSDLLGICTHEGGLTLIDGGDGRVVRETRISGAAPEQAPQVSDLRWSPDGQALAVSCRDGSVHFFDPATLRIRKSIHASNSQIRSIVFTPDGRSLIAVGDEGRVIVIDRSSGAVRRSERVSEESLFTLAIHPGGQTCVVGDRAGRVIVLSMEPMRALATLNAGGAVMSLEFTPDGERLLIAALDKAVERWDFSSLLRTIPVIRSAE
jgi:WD40 repeat protein/predicted Ser/Thr protein kinase